MAEGEGTLAGASSSRRMGVDFTAVCDHDLTWSELYVLPARLDAIWSLPPTLAPWVAEHVRSAPASWAWERDPAFSNTAEELFEAGYLSMVGPHGFSGTAFRRSIEIHHVARWWTFLHDRDVQLGLQLCARLIAQSVRATHLLYVPDSGLPPARASDALFEGDSVESVVARLRTEVGPPLTSPRDFLDRESEEWDERGWFYDTVAG